MKYDYDINKLFEFFKYWKDYTHPTEFYNEGWLLKLVVLSVTDHAANKVELRGHPLFVDHESKFFSEGLLFSPFLAKPGKKQFAESHTHADGVIGDFSIGNDKSKGSVHLKGNKLNVFEAKINSEFSKDVTNASFYNQAARYIACITETIDKAEKLEVLNDLTIGFFLLVPKDQYKAKKSFEKFLDKKHIFETVKKRVDQYVKEDDYKERKEWFDKKFSPVLEKIDIEPTFYEDIISDLKDYEFHYEINKFYESCLQYNK
ncbi:hypothetical protein [Flavobacterium sp.]|uniref:hypothetical protein n=1 Tax=Flavobacterium sp. TaxID=239 RepID=UPI002487466B|nr:hypothetical protein [Flavobacterium sp.]MDI1318091.1 hypothetical protein [Flavobacterium sp.]